MKNKWVGIGSLVITGGMVAGSAFLIVDRVKKHKSAVNPRENYLIVKDVNLNNIHEIQLTLYLYSQKNEDVQIVYKGVKHIVHLHTPDGSGKLVSIPSFQTDQEALDAFLKVYNDSDMSSLINITPEGSTQVGQAIIKNASEVFKASNFAGNVRVELSDGFLVDNSGRKIKDVISKHFVDYWSGTIFKGTTVTVDTEELWPTSPKSITVNYTIHGINNDEFTDSATINFVASK